MKQRNLLDNTGWKTKKKATQNEIKAYSKMYQQDWFAMLVTVVASALDGSVLLKVFQQALVESPILSFCTAATIAFILNLAPLLGSHSLKAYKKTRKKEYKVYSLLMLGLFAGLWVVTVVMRFSLINDTGAQQLLVNGVAVEPAKASFGKIMTTTLYSLEPAATSLLTFVIGSLSSETAAAIKFHKLRIVELEEKKTRLMEAKAILEGHIKTLDEAEKALYQSAVDQVEAILTRLKTEAQYARAGDPDEVSTLGL